MKMDIPAYMSIEANEETRTRTLSILDANDRKQREMWGEFALSAHDARACAKKKRANRPQKEPSEHTSQIIFSA